MKIIDWIKLHKKLSLFVFSVVFFGIFLIISLTPNNPSPTLTPTPITNTLSLNYPDIYPKTGKVEMGGLTTGISLFFDMPINKNSVQIEATPNINFSTSVLADFPNRIIVIPSTAWETGKNYRIKILKGLLSLDGKYQLKSDIEINYDIQEIPSFNLE